MASPTGVMGPPFRGDGNIPMPAYMNTGEPIAHRLSFHQPGSLGIRDHMNRAYGPHEHMTSGYPGPHQPMTSGYSRANLLPAPVAQSFQPGAQYQYWATTTPNSYALAASTMGVMEPAMTQMDPMNLMPSIPWQNGGFQDQHPTTSQTMFGVGPDAASVLWQPQAEQRL
jgi:hypothetical protein